MPARIDLTVTGDTGDPLMTPRNFQVAVDLIGTVVDVSSASHPSGAQTKISLKETVQDCSQGAPGVPVTRTLLVLEGYRTVCMLIDHAESNEPI